MKLPSLSAGAALMFEQASASRFLGNRLNAAAPQGIRPAQCTHAQDQVLGACIDNTGMMIGNTYNCTACCALRVAQGGGMWVDPGTGTPVFC